MNLAVCGRDEKVAPPVMREEGGAASRFRQQGVRRPVEHHRVAARDALDQGVAQAWRAKECRRKPDMPAPFVYEFRA